MRLKGDRGEGGGGTAAAAAAAAAAADVDAAWSRGRDAAEARADEPRGSGFSAAIRANDCPARPCRHLKLKVFGKHPSLPDGEILPRHAEEDLRRVASSSGRVEPEPASGAGPAHSGDGPRASQLRRESASEHPGKLRARCVPESEVRMQS